MKMTGRYFCRSREFNSIKDRYNLAVKDDGEFWSASFTFISL